MNQDVNTETQSFTLGLCVINVFKTGTKNQRSDFSKEKQKNGSCVNKEKHGS